MSDDNFENRITEIDNAISKLESGELSLDESIKLYTHAISVTKECFSQLDKAKLTVEKVNDQLIKDSND